MLNKKYQVLLSSWMEDYIKYIAEKYKLNYSSSLRAHLCLGILFVTSILEPDYKIDINHKELVEFSNKAKKNDSIREEGHQLFSKIVFEARKAAEYRLSKEKMD